jgi:hypothetical protein
VLWIARLVTIVVAVGDQRRQERRQTVGDGYDRIVLPELEEGPRSTAVLGWCRASAADAHRVPPPGIERQDLFEPHLVVAAIDEVVLVQEALSEAQTESSQSHTAWIDQTILPYIRPWMTKRS